MAVRLYMAGRQCIYTWQPVCLQEGVMMCNGDEFKSFTELPFVTKFWNSNEPRVCSYIHIRISRLIVSAVKRPSKKDYNDSFKYGKIEYACIHGGRT